MTDHQIVKVLSANDTGETGGHQAGLLIPKEPRLLSFFPSLNKKAYNPRVHLQFIDDSGSYWEFAFIYYNNVFHGGTRNEYRLTRMTRYMRSAGVVAGDEVILSRKEGRYRVAFKRARQVDMKDGVLRLGSGWRVVQI